MKIKIELASGLKFECEITAEELAHCENTKEYKKLDAMQRRIFEIRKTNPDYSPNKSTREILELVDMYFQKVANVRTEEIITKKNNLLKNKKRLI